MKEDRSCASIDRAHFEVLEFLIKFTLQCIPEEAERQDVRNYEDR